VVRAAKIDGFDGKEVEDMERQWSFSGGLLYSFTVITTIGNYQLIYYWNPLLPVDIDVLQYSNHITFPKQFQTESDTVKLSFDSLIYFISIIKSIGNVPTFWKGVLNFVYTTRHHLI